MGEGSSRSWWKERGTHVLRFGGFLFLLAVVLCLPMAYWAWKGDPGGFKYFKWALDIVNSPPAPGWPTQRVFLRIIAITLVCLPAVPTLVLMGASRTVWALEDHDEDRQ